MGHTLTNQPGVYFISPGFLLTCKYQNHGMSSAALATRPSRPDPKEQAAAIEMLGTRAAGTGRV